MRYVLYLVVMMMAANAYGAERYKALPSDHDNAQMEETLRSARAVSLEEFLVKPQEFHWVTFYEAAAQLFTQGRKDEAVQWLYAGQIRARVAAGLDPDPSRNNALLTSLNYGLGTPINAYAKSDTKNWVAQIDTALAWDQAHPLPADPAQVIGISDVAWDTANFHAVYAQVRAGLKTMRAGLTR